MNNQRRPDRGRKRDGSRKQPEGSDRRPPLDASFDEHKAILSLREYVGRAADEIDRLRRKNTELTGLVAELQTDMADRERRQLQAPDEDPEILRDKISGFIDTIDRYLERYHADQDENEETEDDLLPDSPPPLSNS
jgi:hypothetical protein